MATNQRILLAVMSCGLHRNGRVKWQRETWLKESDPRIDVRFFYGNGVKNPLPDEVVLNCPDDYVNFPLKVKAMQAWSLEQGYPWVLKVDDDTYGVLSRIADAVPTSGDYVGRLRGPSGSKPAPYASGFAYWTSTRAREVAVAHKWDYDAAEDRYLANVLFDAGIKCDYDYRFVVHQSKRNALSGKEGCRYNNGVVVSCEYEVAEHMHAEHAKWTGKAPSDRPMSSIPDGPFSDVDVLVKTFMRDGYLSECLNHMEKAYRSARFVIVDDGWHDKAKSQRYSDLRFWGHTVSILPFDQGFGAKANEGIRQSRRKYMLIASDDFIMDSASADGVRRMLDVMEARPDVGFCGGRVNAQPYEGDFSVEGGVVTEARKAGPIMHAGATPYFEVDLAVNWGLVRADLFKRGLHWCPEWKIGGDHFRFFWQLKQLGAKAAVVPMANVRTMPNVPSWKLTEFDSMRARAWEALPGFFKKQGITRYRLFDGSFDELRGDKLVHCTPTGQVTHEVPVNDKTSTVRCGVCGYEEVL